MLTIFLLKFYFEVQKKTLIFVSRKQRCFFIKLIIMSESKNLRRTTIAKKVQEILTRIDTIEDQVGCEPYNGKQQYTIDVKMPFFDIENHFSHIAEIFLTPFLKKQGDVSEYYLNDLRDEFFSMFLECEHLTEIRDLKDAKQLLNETGFCGFPFIDSIKNEKKRFKKFQKYYTETIIEHNLIDNLRINNELSIVGCSGGNLAIDLVKDINSLREDLNNILDEIEKGETLDYINWLWENIEIFDLEKLEFIVPIINNSKPSKKGFEDYLDNECETWFGQDAKIEITDEMYDSIMENLLESYLTYDKTVTKTNFAILGDITPKGLTFLFNPEKSPLEALKDINTGVYLMTDDDYSVERQDIIPKHLKGDVNTIGEFYDKLKMDLLKPFWGFKKSLTGLSLAVKLNGKK
jgi:hypothetical protein